VYLGERFFGIFVHLDQLHDDIFSSKVILVQVGAPQSSHEHFEVVVDLHLGSHILHLLGHVAHAHAL
jgi:hypothetical protein